MTQNPHPENHEPTKTGIPNRKKSRSNVGLSCKPDYFKAPACPLATGTSEFFTADYDADRSREDTEAKGGVAVIPMRRGRKVQAPIDDHIYALRNRIERCFNKLKNA